MQSSWPTRGGGGAVAVCRPGDGAGLLPVYLYAEESEAGCRALSFVWSEGYAQQVTLCLQILPVRCGIGCGYVGHA